MGLKNRHEGVRGSNKVIHCYVTRAKDRVKNRHEGVRGSNNVIHCYIIRAEDGVKKQA